MACPPTYGYVDGLKKLLFNFPKEKREEIIKKYASRTPEPLNRQFSKRLSKEEAIKNQNKLHNKLMATVNQAVVNPLLDAPAKARGHLIVTRRKVANKVTHSLLSMSAFSWSLLLFFEVYTK